LETWLILWIPESNPNLDYAFDQQLGFLTACPTNLGTGMRASVMMHLPGLVMSKNMDKVINAVNHLGHRGAWLIWRRLRCQW
jgi:protein-arginine kinase